MFLFGRSSLGILALDLLCVLSVLAQTKTATLSEAVVDLKGRPVPEVQVKETRIEIDLNNLTKQK